MAYSLSARNNNNKVIHMIISLNFHFMTHAPEPYVTVINPAPPLACHFTLHHKGEGWVGCCFYLLQSACIQIQGFVFPLSRKGKTMGCVKSKEDKGPAMKYQPDNSLVSDPNTAATTPHIGHYGPDPTQLQQNLPPTSTSGSGAANFNHTLTPFGGSSSAITPFGGMSSSFSGPVSNSFSGGVSSE